MLSVIASLDSSMNFIGSEIENSDKDACTKKRNRIE